MKKFKVEIELILGDKVKPVNIAEFMDLYLTKYLCTQKGERIDTIQVKYKNGNKKD